MSTLIKLTPTLTGADSRRFNKILKAEQYIKVSPEEKERIENLVKTVLANSNFK